jgi:hypothetical protein
MPFRELSELLADREIVSGAGASRQEITAAQAAIGPLPIDYQQFLQEYGWLQVEGNEIYGLGEGIPPYLDVVRMTLSERSEPAVPIPSSWICVMNDGGGNLICFDSKAVSETDPNTAILFWDHELGVTQPSDIIGTSFTDWLSELLSE